jgi:LysM repeat protein
VPPSVGAIARDRRGGQLALAGLLVAAFAAVAVARLSGGGGPNQLGAIASSAPSPSAAASTPFATPEPTVLPTEAPTAPPSAPPTAAPSPSPSAAHDTYTVRSGDTLTAIARRFGTTIDAIAELNNIAKADRNNLYVGQVLLIP